MSTTAPSAACSCPTTSLQHHRVLFASCPSGAFCREDRCQSFFDAKLIPSLRAPMEECEAAGAIASLGARAFIVDSAAEQLTDRAFLDRVVSSAPDIIVLAVTFGSLTQDLAWAARINKVLPSVPIGLRGAPCYVWAEQLLRQHPSISFCVQGDYEVVFDEILKKGIRFAAGVTARATDGTILNNAPAYEAVLDRLPLPDRTGINPQLYRVRGFGAIQATIHVQRGCPYPCSYCLVHTVTGKKVRHRSAQHIVREIQQLQAQGVSYFYFRAETFTLNRTWALELARQLQEHCPGIHWVTTTRIEHVDDELLAALRAAGCYGLSFGVDVASEEIGKRVRKPVLPKETFQAMRLCDKHGILSLAYVMIGFIWDTRQTLQEAADFMLQARPDLLTVHFAHPYPGTDYYEAVRLSGHRVTSLHAQAEPALELSSISSKELAKFGKQLLLRHYRRPAVLWSLIRKNFRLLMDRLRARLT